MACPLSTTKLSKNYVEIIKDIEVFEDLFSVPVFILVLKDFCTVSITIMDMMYVPDWASKLGTEASFYFLYIFGTLGFLTICAANIPLEMQRIRSVLLNKMSASSTEGRLLCNVKNIELLLNRDVCVLTACNVFQFDRVFLLKALISVIAQAAVIYQLGSLLVETSSKNENSTTLNNSITKLHELHLSQKRQNLRWTAGGTLILVKNSLKHYCLPTPPLRALEATNIILTPPKHDPISITCVYIPPSSDENLFTIDIEHFIQTASNCILFADFNATHNAWNCKNNTTRGRHLFNFANMLNLNIAFPSTPTRFGHNSANTIDIALIKNFYYPFTINSIDDLSSDHNPVFLNFNFKLAEAPQIPERSPQTGKLSK
ncbi:hypothetical protein TNCV_4839031 [Trichonephila clavipes]|nr:hypothetical protein TNCV_4839031 [Trichonephila clavipes]